jgi:hypothetical protein
LVSRIAPRKPLIATSATAPIAIPAFAPVERVLELELLSWAFVIGRVGPDLEDELVVDARELVVDT